MPKLNLPNNPTPEQVNAVRLAIVRQVFEDSATNYRPVDPPEGILWKGLYTVGDRDFYIEYDGTDLTKWPVGGGQDG
jgi:hypothetical protein